MTSQKKGLCLPISGFSFSKEKKLKWCHPKMVTPGAGRPPPPPPVATPLRCKKRIIPSECEQRDRLSYFANRVTEA